MQFIKQELTKISQALAFKVISLPLDRASALSAGYQIGGRKALQLATHSGLYKGILILLIQPVPLEFVSKGFA
jgi:hypothetical protein